MWRILTNIISCIIYICIAIFIFNSYPCEISSSCLPSLCLCLCFSHSPAGSSRKPGQKHIEDALAHCYKGKNEKQSIKNSFWNWKFGGLGTWNTFALGVQWSGFWTLARFWMYKESWQWVSWEGRGKPRKQEMVVPILPPTFLRKGFRQTVNRLVKGPGCRVGSRAGLQMFGG